MRDIDTSVAHPARVYDYMIGGKDHYEADRVLADRMAAALPTLPVMLRANRAFLGRVVPVLVAELGMRQFLDLGSGLPTGNNVHQAAQAVDPMCRVVYIDNDPIVFAHGQALLASDPRGKTAFIAGDATDVQRVLDDPLLVGTLDLEQPVALMALSFLMYFPDEVVRDVVTGYLGALAPGSTLTLTHPTADFDPEGAARAAASARAGGLTYIPRSKAEITALLDGPEMLEPGVVPLGAWRPEDPSADPHAAHYWVATVRTR